MKLEDILKFELDGIKFNQKEANDIFIYFKNKYIDELFLMNFIVGDIQEALEIDNPSKWKLPLYNAFFKKHMPARAWGSRARFEHWVEI